MTQLEALKKIAKQNNGLLRPKDVVDSARPENSPLHGAFEWEDTVAAEKYRLLQAQDLIRSFRMVIESDKKNVKVPVFIGVSSDRTSSKSENPFRLMDEVRSSPDLLKIAVKDALDQLCALRNRYGYLSLLQDIWALIDKHAQVAEA